MRAHPTRFSKLRQEAEVQDGMIQYHERSRPRRTCHFNCSIVSRTGAETPAVLLDVSGVGFKLKCRQVPVIGSRILIQVSRHVPLTGRVRWALGCEAGGIFETRNATEEEAIIAIAESLGIATASGGLREAVQRM